MPDAKKFDIGISYTKQEFLSVYEALLDQNSGDEAFVKMAKGHIKWAKGHPANSLITWEEIDGVMYPVASTSINQG